MLFCCISAMLTVVTVCPLRLPLPAMLISGLLAPAERNAPMTDDRTS